MYNRPTHTRRLLPLVFLIASLASLLIRGIGFQPVRPWDMSIRPTLAQQPEILRGTGLQPVLLAGADLAAARLEAYPTKLEASPTKKGSVKTGWTIRTVGGTGDPANNGDSGTATKINISDPFGVEIGPDKSLYVTEVGHHRVRRIDLEKNRITTVAGTGQKGYSGDGGPATKAAMNEPYEVRFDGDGNMYVVEMQNHLVRRIDKATGRIRTIAGTGKPGFSGDGGAANRARLSRPHSIALDGRGGLYIADIGNHRIRRVDLNSGIITTLAGSAERRLPADGQQARGNPILGPRALYIAGDTMWIALREGHSVWKMNLKDTLLRHVAGSGKKGYQGDGGDPLRATFNGPKGIVVDRGGRIHVVDTENQAIRLIDLKQNRIVTSAGSGVRGGEGDGGPSTRAQLARPHGICVDSAGRVFIGDTLNHRVRMLTPVTAK